VHGGLLHLAVNMYALYSLGPAAERLWGPARFLVLYFLTGLGSSCVAVIVNPAGSIGASGALCGLIGAEAGWLWLNRAFLPPPLVSAWARNLLINTLIIVFISTMPRISAAAHYSGAVVGIVVAFLLNTQRFGSAAHRRLAIVGLIAVPVIGVGLVLRTMHEDPAWQARVRLFEAADFEETYLKDINDGVNGALIVYQNQVEPLIDQNPRRRDAAEVEKARAAMTAQRSRLDALTARLEQQRPYTSPEVEQLRGLTQETIAAAAQLCMDSDQALQAGPQWREAEQALVQQLKKTDLLWKNWGEEWNALVRRVKVR
jgi:hypothetical protein